MPAKLDRLIGYANRHRDGGSSYGNGAAAFFIKMLTKFGEAYFLNVF